MTVPVAAADPVCGYPDFRLADVVLRLARADERREWNQLMDAQHYLGFRQFAGRGLRYVAEWRGRWLALLGWQTVPVRPARRVDRLAQGGADAPPAPVREQYAKCAVPRYAL